MARGPKKHLKRLSAPSHWMLDKLGGIYAPRPRAGPHKLRECLPLMLVVRNRLKYALTYREAMLILKQRFLKVDNRVRTDPKFPAGFMDVITIEKTGDKFRLLYDTKGRFVLHRIEDKEVGLKLCRVNKKYFGDRRRPFVSTHDGRTIGYPDPNIKRGDTVVVDVETGKINEWVRFKIGAMVMVIKGGNTGRVGEIISRERHPGSFDLVHIKDAKDTMFATRLENCFVIGRSSHEILVTLPKDKGARLSLVEDRNRRLATQGKKGKKK
jgi:small subunit ribosomal protein S4e